MGPLVYLDVCCFKRPFDDHRQERVRLESAAVAAIIARAERGEARLVRSPAHDLENRRNPREDRRLAAAAWLNGASVEVQLSDRVAARARLLGTLGFQPLDALHVEFTEGAGTTWLATADDRMLTLARRHAPSLRVAVANPRVVAGQLIEEEP